MPTAIVKLSKEANHVINIVKAKYDLNDKSEAINKITEEYETEILEQELRPDYINRLKKLKKQKAKLIGNYKNFEKYFEH